MRTALAALALLAPLAALSAAPPPKPGPSPATAPLPVRGAGGCELPTVTYARQPQSAKQAQKLGDLPAANSYLAVERHVGGCPEPAVLRTGIGN
jgi:hypothetical protein